MRRAHRFVLLLGGLLLVLPTTHAQTIGELARRPASPRFFSVQGALTTTAEGYTTTGSSRRAPFVARQQAQLGLSLFGISTDLALLYSTDQSNRRQSVNRLGFNSEWTWGKAAFGYTNPQISEYSVNGVTILGAGLTLTPGAFHLEAFHGRSQRGVESSLDTLGLFPLQRDGTFARTISGFRVGVGQEQGSHFHLAGSRIADDPKSIRTPGDARPAENLVVTTLTGLSILRRRVAVNAEGTLSLLNADMNATPIDLDNLLDPDSTDLPAALLPVARTITSLITPTYATRIGYATRVRGRANFRAWGVNGEYGLIGPGFESLGLASVRNDETWWRVNPSLRVFNSRVNLNAQLGRRENNVSRLRSSTLEQNSMLFTGQFRLHERLSVQTQWGQDLGTTTITGATGASERSQESYRWSVSPTLTLPLLGLTHTISPSVGRQIVVSPNGARFLTLNGQVSWTTALSEKQRLSAVYARVASESSLSETNVNTVTLSTTRTFSQTLSATVGSTFTNSNNTVGAVETSLFQASVNAEGAWNATAKDRVSLQLRGTNTRADAPSPSFREGTFTFSYQRRL